MGAPARLDGGLTVADVDELHNALHKLELTVATLAGKVESLMEHRKNEYDHLIERIEQVNHRRRSTDATLEKAVDLLHAYPKPSKIDELIEDVATLQEWRQRMVGLALGIAAGSGLLSGGIVAAVVRATGG